MAGWFGAGLARRRPQWQAGERYPLSMVSTPSSEAGASPTPICGHRAKPLMRWRYCLAIGAKWRRLFVMLFALANTG